MVSEFGGIPDEELKARSWSQGKVFNTHIWSFLESVLVFPDGFSLRGCVTTFFGEFY